VEETPGKIYASLSLFTFPPLLLACFPSREDTFHFRPFKSPTSPFTARNPLSNATASPPFFFSGRRRFFVAGDLNPESTRIRALRVHPFLFSFPFLRFPFSLFREGIAGFPLGTSSDPGSSSTRNSPPPPFPSVWPGFLLAAFRAEVRPRLHPRTSPLPPLLRRAYFGEDFFLNVRVGPPNAQLFGP